VTRQTFREEQETYRQKLVACILETRDPMLRARRVAYTHLDPDLAAIVESIDRKLTMLLGTLEDLKGRP
jgi:hypothetical protein